MIEVQNIKFEYPNMPPVFDQFNWSVDRGDAWSIIGPSGCGKSTLLYLLSGLRLPSSGRIAIDGIQVTHPRPQNGLIIQDYGLLPWATVRKNVALGLDIRQFYGPDGIHAPIENDQKKMSIDPWLDRLGLADQANKFPSQLSGGQRQRTAIARTLVLNPDLLMMDEPFSSLDAPTREGLQQLVLELWREQNLTLLTVTHSIEEAAILGERILLLEVPPNRDAQVIENPDMSRPGYRQSDAYLQICQQLRERMSQ
ncbi:MAG: ABC transporter ATP-binding protein [Anaerolineaceae bacterium]